MAPLQPPLLEQIVAHGSAERRDGTPIRLHSQISRPHAEALQRLVERRKPERALEIGMAYGVASLAILGAGARRLTSIDPFQSADWEGVGRHGVERAGFAERHTLIEQPDHLALPQLVQGGERVQLAYIDGWHTFDHTLLDFFYVDKLLDVGGVVAFNDCSLRAVHRVTRFVTTHRHYREIDAGLPRTYASLRARLQRRQQEDRYFEKLADEQPSWDFYAPF